MLYMGGIGLGASSLVHLLALCLIPRTASVWLVWITLVCWKLGAATITLARYLVLVGPPVEQSQQQQQQQQQQHDEEGGRAGSEGGEAPPVTSPPRTRRRLSAPGLAYDLILWESIAPWLPLLVCTASSWWHDGGTIGFNIRRGGLFRDGGGGLSAAQWSSTVLWVGESGPHALGWLGWVLGLLYWRHRCWCNWLEEPPPPQPMASSPGKSLFSSKKKKRKRKRLKSSADCCQCGNSDGNGLRCCCCQLTGKEGLLNTDCMVRPLWRILTCRRHGPTPRRRKVLGRFLGTLLLLFLVPFLWILQDTDANGGKYDLSWKRGAVAGLHFPELEAWYCPSLVNPHCQSALSICLSV